MWQWRTRIWDRIIRGGKRAYIGSLILVLFLTFLIGDLGDLFLFHLKWVDSAKFHPWLDLFSALIGGMFGGVIGWADIERKQENEARKRAGLDATMI